MMQIRQNISLKNTLKSIAFCALLTAFSPQAANANGLVLYDTHDEVLFSVKMPNLPSYQNSDEYEAYDTGIHITDQGLAVDMQEDYFISFGMNKEDSYRTSQSEIHSYNPIDEETSSFKFGISYGYRF